MYNKNEWSSELKLKEEFAAFISKNMAKADWYYDYADDSFQWNKGNTEIKKLIDDLKLLSGLEGGIERAKKIWKLHVPINSVNEPAFFSNPELINSVMNGFIMKQDIPAIQEILEKSQREGHYFTAIKSNALELPENRFIGFASITDARNYVYENTTPTQRFIIHSIASIKSELNAALLPEKESILKKIAERLQVYQKAEIRQRNSERSR